jgi:signal transduction histidine kinase
VVVGYALVFTAAALACFASSLRARRVDHDGTRHGLAALLLTSGAWAATQAGFIAARSERLATALYLIGLLFGFATIFAWLYFASAYTGRTYHRDPTYRRLGLGLYLAVAAVKLTNPIHELYFTTDFTSEPFPHLIVELGIFHWAATGLSYVLAAIGLFVLFERFAEADYDTRILAVLVAITGLPIILDAIGYVSPYLLDIVYAPLGVAVFALGVLFVAQERFVAVRLTGTTEGAVVLLDEAGRIRDYDREARELFPGLATAVGDPIETIAPLAARDDDGEIIELTGKGEGSSDDDDEGGTGERRYYLTTEEAIGLGRADLGRVLLFSDVTAIERQRRELKRHNDQLEGFAIWVRHELRNALMVVGGYTDVADEALTNGDTETASEALDTVSGAADRMNGTADDLATLARHGRTIERTEAVEFHGTVATAWTAIETGELDLSIEGEGTIEADGPRLRKLFENAFEFYTHNGGSELTVSLREEDFAISDDGQPPPPDAAARYFDYGDTAPETSAGMALPNVRTLARVHGWSATIDLEYTDGLRIVVAGAVVRETSTPTSQ